MSEPKHALLVVDGYYLSQTNWRQKRDGHGELGMAELVSFLEQRHGISFYEKFYLDSTPDAPTPHHTATLNKLRHLGFDQSDDYKYKQQAVVSPSGERFTITVAAGVDVGICATLLQRGIGLKPMQSAVNISTIVLVAGDGDFKQPLKICKDFGKKLVLVFSRHLISGQIRQLAHSEVVLEDHWPSLTLSPQPPPPHRTAAPVATAATIGATTIQSGQGPGPGHQPLESIHTATGAGGPNAAFFTRQAPDLPAGVSAATVVDADSSSAARARQRWKQAKDQVMNTIRKRSNGSNSGGTGSVSGGGRNGADSVPLQRTPQPAPALAEMAMAQLAESGPGPGTRYPVPPRRDASRYASQPGLGLRPMPVAQSAATRRRACSGVPLPGPPPGRPPASLPRGVKPPRGPPPRGPNGTAGHGVNGRYGVSRSQPNSARSHDGRGYAHHGHHRGAGTSMYESRLPAGTLSARSEAGVTAAHSGGGSGSYDPLNGGHSVYGTMGHPAPPLPNRQPHSRPRPLPGQMPQPQPGVDQSSMGAGRGPRPRAGQRGSLSIVVDDPMVAKAAAGAAADRQRNGRNGTGNGNGLSGAGNKRKGTRASATDERLMATSLLSLEAAGDDADAVVAGLSELRGHVMVSQPAANANITERIVRLMGAFGTDGDQDASAAVQRSGLALLTAMASCGSDPDAVDKVIEGGGVESAKGIVAARCFNVDEDTVLAALELLNLLTAAPAPGAATKKQRAARAAAVAKARLMPVVLDATQRYQGSSLVDVCMGVLRNITSQTPSPTGRSPSNFG